MKRMNEALERASQAALVLPAAKGTRIWSVGNDELTGRFYVKVGGQHVAAICNRLDEATFEVLRGQAKEDAGFIVRACNAHRELLDTLKKAERWLTNISVNNPDECRRSKPNDIGLNGIREAIANAEKGETK